MVARVWLKCIEWFKEICLRVLGIISLGIIITNHSYVIGFPGRCGLCTSPEKSDSCFLFTSNKSYLSGEYVRRSLEEISGC